MLEVLKIAVYQIIEAMNQGKLDLWDELYTVDVICHRPPYPEIYGLEGLKELGARWLNAYPDSEFALDKMIAEGDTVAAWLTCRATHASSGKQVSRSGCTRYRFEGSKVAEEWQHWDEP